MQNAGANYKQRKSFPYLDRGFHHTGLLFGSYVEGIPHEDSDIALPHSVQPLIP
jgi:hypothetical protein